MSNLIFSIIFLLIPIFAISQHSTEGNCKLYTAEIEENDTLFMTATVWHHNRIEEYEEILVYYFNGSLIAVIKSECPMDNSIKCDTTIKLNKLDIQKIDYFEISIRNQNLKSNQIGFSGKSFIYEISFKQGKVIYHSDSINFSICKELIARVK
jgi:hypothetical protein